jgi:hypothetical protein
LPGYLYILEDNPRPRGEISADVIRGYEKRKRKRGKCERKGKEKGRKGIRKR